jgi:hypothetical protein
MLYSDIFYLFSSALLISLNFPFICVLNFLSFRATFCFTNPDDLCPQLLRIIEGLLLYYMYIYIYLIMVRWKMCIQDILSSEIQRYIFIEYY